MSRLQVFTFENINIKEACWIDGKPYFTRRAIGEWLGYPNPKKMIAKILERNSFIEEFARVVKLTTLEGTRIVEREVEVYDPIGLQLIVMESRQPKACQFKISAARLVYAYASGALRHLRPRKSIWRDPYAVPGSYLSAAQIPSGDKLTNVVYAFASLDGKTRSTIYRRLQAVRGGNVLTRDGLRPRKSPARVAASV
jgi:hypothetical protein